MAKHGNVPAAEADHVVALAEHQANEAAAEIGEEWAKRQKNGRSYSGLNVLDLADSIGLPYLYHAFIARPTPAFTAPMPATTSSPNSGPTAALLSGRAPATRVLPRRWRFRA